jgi:ATP dependent DNA ligase-like protein
MSQRGACGRCCAARRAGRLVYVGRSSVVTRAAVEEIVSLCAVRARPACETGERGQGVVWIEPRAVVEVAFSELMLGRLRDPVVRAVVSSSPRGRWWSPPPGALALPPSTRP